MIIIDLIAFISYLIIPSGVVYFGDIQMILGCIVGVRFTLKNIKPNQSFFIYGIIVGLGGSLMTGISLTMFDWVYYSESSSFSLFMLLIVFEFYFIEAIVIGLTVGSIVGAYYHHKSKIRIESSLRMKNFSRTS